jgi:hypothetical protein
MSLWWLNWFELLLWGGELVVVDEDEDVDETDEEELK